MAALVATGQSYRLFWIDGAAVRFKSRRHADPRGKKGPQLRSKRRKNVDHQRLHRGCCGRLGQVRRPKNSRILSREEPPWIQNLGCTRKMVAAGFRHFRTLLHRLRNPRRKPASKSIRVERSVGLPEPG